MAISDFRFDKTNGSLQWSSGSRTVQVPASGLEQAQADPLNDRVLALPAAPQGLPTCLKVFAASGELLAQLPPPKGFQFYYLTPYPKLGIAVVCVSAEAVEGFKDWHFGLDAASKKLVRHAPAY